MEELSEEDKQIFDLLKRSAKEAVEDRVNSYQSSAARAMTDMIKDNDAKFSALNVKVDGAMTEIHRALDKLNGTSTSTAATPRAPREEREGQSRRRDAFHGRRTGCYIPPLARGTQDSEYLDSSDKIGEEFSVECSDHFSPGPRVDLPRFDCSHPHLWQTRCEEYFALWGTTRQLWIPYASAQFDGVATKWLESFRSSSPNADWEEFCLALLARFGRNQHATLLRRMFHIYQLTTVEAYVEEFSQLMDQLPAYGKHPDPLYYITRFMNGLKPTVRLMVAILLPEDLDEAYQLALLHEELGDGSTPINQQFQNTVRRPYVPVAQQQNLPIPQAAPKLDRAPMQPIRPAAVEDKWSAFRNYRRAKGLCFICGERWGKEHKCQGTVQLHFVQEMVELLQTENDENSQQSVDASELMCLSATTLGFDKPSLATQIEIEIEGKRFSMLIDFGSSHSFLNTEVASSLPGVSTMTPTVKVADGESLISSSHIPNCKWQYGQAQFTTQFRILSLGQYDGILGLDWLASLGPMSVD
uniref:Uncharacterized protein n=1 Tax=Avena sativa TaxID=4498 RepID=A0ACD5VUE0_AVESA